MQTIESRVSRWNAFICGGGNGARGGAPFMFTVSYPTSAGERPFPNKDLRERIDWALRNLEDELDHLREIEDDLVPCMRPYTGTEIFAEAFGCPVQRPDDHMPFARPAIHSLSEIDALLVPDLSATSLADVFTIADRLREAAGDTVPMKLPDIQSPMGIAALVLEKAIFLTALMDEPAACRHLANKTMSLVTRFLDRWFERYGTSFVAHHPDYYMEAGVTLSEDEIGSVGPEIFRRYFLPDLNALSQKYGGIGIHCCADARHQWENMADIENLKMLNLSTRWLEDPDVTAADAYQFFAGRTCQFHFGRTFAGEPWTWPGQVPMNAKAVFTITAESKDQAKMIADRMNDLR